MRVQQTAPNGWGSRTEGVEDFPGGPVVKNSPSNVGDMGSIPGQGTQIPHAMGQLSPTRHNDWAHTPQRESPRPQTTEPTQPGAHAPQLERENLHAATREEKDRVPQLERSLCAATKIPHAATKTRRNQK